MSNLDRVAERLERVTRYEKYLLSLCPFHDDHNPSFLVYEDYYRCKSCGKKGKTSSLLQKLDKTYIRPKPIQRYPASNPWTKWLQTDPLAETCYRAYKLLKRLPHQGIYLHRRGIDEPLIDRVKIGYRDGWYLIPIFDQKSTVIGAVARQGSGDSDLRYMTPHNQEMLLYCPNWKRLEQSRSVFIVYGVLDCVSMEKMGVACVTGTLGKNLDPLLLNDIRKKMYIIPDNGEEREANILASRLGWRGNVIYPDYPVDAKDPNDLLNRYPERLEEIIDEVSGCKRDRSRVGDRQESELKCHQIRNTYTAV